MHSVHRIRKTRAGILLALLSLIASVTVQLQPARSLAASTCPSGGVSVPVTWTAATWQQRIGASNPGTTWCVADGVHTILKALTFHDGDVVLGIDDPSVKGSPTVTGAAPITHWTQRSSDTWRGSVSGMKNPASAPGFVKSIPCLDGTDHCWYPDDVYFGESHPRRVWTLKELDGAKGPAYYEDYGSHTVVVNRNPSKMAVARAVPLARPSQYHGLGLLANATHVTVRDLTVEKVGTAMQTGAIDGTGLHVDGVDVRFSHAAGVRTERGGTVVDSHVRDNGQVGLIAFGGAPSILSDAVERNGWLRCDALCGGMKVAGGKGATIGAKGQGNTFDSNDGPGIWIDASTINFSIGYNTIFHNTGAGVAIEASYDGIVAHNVIYGNGIPRWQRDQYGGVWINASGSCTKRCPSKQIFHGIQVTGNVIGAKETSKGLVGVPNAAATKVKQSANKGSGAYGPWEVRDIHITHNTIWQCPSPYPPQWLAGIQTTSDWAAFDAKRHIQWDYNKYAAPASSTKPFHWWAYGSGGRKVMRSISWSGWRSNAHQDPHSTYSKSISC